MEHSGQMDDAWQPKCHDLIPVRQLAQRRDTECCPREATRGQGVFTPYGDYDILVVRERS